MKNLKLILIVCLVIAAISIIACGSDHKGHNHGDMNQEETKVDSSIIRTGVIDLHEIDRNKDGMVFQDPMDWNVISDEPGKCPLCKMELVEVTLVQVKENLTKNDFKVKDN